MSKEITYISLVGGLYSRDQLNDAIEHINLLEAENEKAAAAMQPKKEWIGLTSKDRKAIFSQCDIADRGYIASMVEAMLKDMNK
jgi:hypothetical protein